jgi:hypothetical protein
MSVDAGTGLTVREGRSWWLERLGGIDILGTVGKRRRRRKFERSKGGVDNRKEEGWCGEDLLT